MFQHLAKSGSNQYFVVPERTVCCIVGQIIINQKYMKSYIILMQPLFSKLYNLY